MSTNPYYRFMLSVAGIKEKEPFFQRAWGKVNILSRQRDRQIYKDLRGSNLELQNLHSKSILNSFNSMTIEHDHAALLEDLANEALIFIEEEARHAEKRAKEELQRSNAIYSYIAKIVETLSPYAGLVNTAVGHTELYTVLTGPEVIVEQVKLPGAHDSFEYRKDYRARFSTRTWSLLFRGVEGRIDIFLLPVDKVMRLTKVESFYKPVARLFAEVQGTQVTWTLDGEEKKAREIMSYILQLFHQLLERTKSQMFRERSHAGGANSELLDLAMARVSFSESDDTMNFDYREGQPDLFGPGETANSSSTVEPQYVEEPIQEQQVIDLTGFNQVTPQGLKQYLLSDRDFASTTKDCLDQYCAATYKVEKPVTEKVAAEVETKKEAKSAKATKRSRSKTKTSKSKREK